MTFARPLLAVAAVSILAGCSGSWWPFGRSGTEQAAVRLPDGAAEYQCAQGKRLVVRLTNDAKSAWIFFPDREFRLDRSASGDRYSNGVSTLIIRDDVLTLESEGNQFVDCRR